MTCHAVPCPQMVVKILLFGTFFHPRCFILAPGLTTGLGGKPGTPSAALPGSGGPIPGGGGGPPGGGGPNKVIRLEMLQHRISIIIFNIISTLAYLQELVVVAVALEHQVLAEVVAVLQ